jgi:hypothetical protein
VNRSHTVKENLLKSMVIDVNFKRHENLKSINFLMFLIYVSELLEEAPMDKNH